ncbi:hypothetical protein [Streptomyces sp. NPDC058206]|uniref:hypothetical protein n=1 Tax=Streptomyces sp. NPDC058206 TaxID=3346382 RepID=UPI0036E89A58
MANDSRESDGYIIPSRTQEMLDAAAREYSYEVLVKARLFADKRHTNTVTPGDISLAMQEISNSDDSDYLQISKKSIRRVTISIIGVMVGATVGYFLARSDLATADTVSTFTALGVSVFAMALSAWQIHPRESKVSITFPPTEEERKGRLVQAWASIEVEMHRNLSERSADRDLRTLPLRSLIEDYVRLNDLGPEFQESLGELISARNRIVHRVKYDLPEDKYQALMATAKRIAQMMSPSDGGDDAILPHP